MKRADTAAIALLPVLMMFATGSSMAGRSDLNDSMSRGGRTASNGRLSGGTIQREFRFVQDEERGMGRTVKAPVDSIAEKRRNLLDQRLKLKRDLKLISTNEIMGDKLWERRKVPRVAFFCNVLLPGLGEVYNGRRIKAALMVGLMSFYVGEAWINYKRSIIRKIARNRQSPGTSRWFFHNQWYEFHRDTAKDYIWWSGAIWVIGMLDAYIDAHLFDLRAYSPEKERGKAKYLIISWKF